MSLPTTLIGAVRYFADLDVCHRYMRQIKWPDGKPCCPDCGSTTSWTTCSATISRRRVWRRSD